MTDERRDDAASRALGTLPSDEAEQLDQELARDAALAAEVEEYRTTVAAMESGVAREQPPSDLFDGVLARIEAERQLGESTVREPTPAATRGRSLLRARRGLLPAFAAGAAVAAAVIAVAFALFTDDALGPAEASAAVRGTAEFAAVNGTATLHSPNREDGVLRLDLAEVPLLSAGEHYEVWVLRAAADGEMEAVGVFTPTGHDIELDLRLPGPGEYEAVDVSVEPDGGAAEHSGRSLAGGRFEPAAT